ncbi:hypothetical protein ACWCSD_00105 [Nonomuraea sp. NPDC001684]
MAHLLTIASRKLDIESGNRGLTSKAFIAHPLCLFDSSGRWIALHVRLPGVHTTPQSPYDRPRMGSAYSDATLDRNGEQMILRACSRVLMGIGLVVLVPSILMQLGVQDKWMRARVVEPSEANASFLTPLVISWMGIGLGIAWVLAAITCFLIPRSMAYLQRTEGRQGGSGAVV